jgi:hypothetical protein
MNEGSRAELTRAVDKVWLERIRPAILEPDTTT